MPTIISGSVCLSNHKTKLRQGKTVIVFVCDQELKGEEVHASSCIFL